MFIVDTKLTSYIAVPSDSDFPIQNLPFGIFKPTKNESPRAGVALGDFVIDLSVLEQQGLININSSNEFVFNRASLNDFIKLGVESCREARKQLVELLRQDTKITEDKKALIQRALYSRDDVTMCLPFEIGDYTDFYASEHHAFNVGSMFRGKGNELMPNWKHLPVGYHGRASSIITTNTPVLRPHGQVLDPETEQPIFSASKRLDFELEMGFFIGKNSQQGCPISIKDAEGHIVGMVLVNDWSARDIQKWEYQPLGPFLSKSFATSISPWLVTLDALAPFRIKGELQDPTPLPYLQQGDEHNSYDIQLEVELQSEKMQTPRTICRTNHKNLYWSIFQQLAHHTITGCNVKVGDMMASGTISGSNPEAFASMLEIAWAGKKPLQLTSGETRVFIQDGDTITMCGYAVGENYRVGFGELKNQVLPNPHYSNLSSLKEVYHDHVV